MAIAEEALTDLTIGKFLRRLAVSEGERVALVWMPDGSEVTYASLDQRTNQLARGLKGIGLEHGQSISVMTENRLEQIYIYLAVAKLGAATVPINTAAKGYFLERFVGNSDSVAIVVEPEFLETVADVIHLLPGLRTLILLDSLDHPCSVPAIPTALAHLDAIEFAAIFDADGEEIDEAEPGDLVQILYTSGTTGPSKGCMYSHTTILFWSWSLAASNEYGRDTVMMVAFPLFHAASWLTSVMTTLWARGKICLCRRFSASRFIPDAASAGVNAALLVGVANFVAAQPPSACDRNHPVIQLCCGPLPADPAGFEARFNVLLTAGFGLSDYGCSHILSPSAARSKPGSCGRPMPYWNCRIVDDQGQEVPAGSPGEILLRNEFPGGGTLGYYKMPEATIESRRDLWFHTGDRGIIDRDGFLYFVDRKKDMIRRRGENISPLELEAILGRNEKIAQACFFALKADQAEDEVAVAVLPKPGSTLHETDVVAYCIDHFPKFAVPRYVRILGALPLTASGKVERHRLKSDAQNAFHTIWDREQAIET